VRIVKGLTSRMKVVEIDGVAQGLVESRLGWRTGRGVSHASGGAACDFERSQLPASRAV